MSRYSKADSVGLPMNYLLDQAIKNLSQPSRVLEAEPEYGTQEYKEWENGVLSDYEDACYKRAKS